MTLTHEQETEIIHRLRMHPVAKFALKRLKASGMTPQQMAADPECGCILTILTGIIFVGSLVEAIVAIYDLIERL